MAVIDRLHAFYRDKSGRFQIHRDCAGLEAGTKAVEGIEFSRLFPQYDLHSSEV